MKVQRRVEISRVGRSRTGDSRQADRPDRATLLGRLTPLLWVDWMDCSLAEEHVLMRSASLLCVDCLWLWFWFRTTATSPASPGKVNEPGRLAGEPGMELQKPEVFFWPGLGGGGGRPSLASGGRGAGGATGRDLETGVEGRGPTVARGTCSVGGCVWSSWFCRGRLA